MPGEIARIFLGGEAQGLFHIGVCSSKVLYKGCAGDSSPPTANMYTTEGGVVWGALCTDIFDVGEDVVYGTIKVVSQESMSNNLSSHHIILII